MFTRELKKHKLGYAILLLGLIGILWAFWHSWPDASRQQLWIISLGAFYTGWGVWHHTQEKTLQMSTVLEYIGMSFFAGLILWFSLSY